MAIQIKEGMIRRTKNKPCAICGEAIEGEENNAYPVTKGSCCDKCFFDIVLPARIDKSEGHKEMRDSLQDLNMLIASEKEAIEDYTQAINNAGEGLELEIYKEILQDEQDHLEKLQALLTGYRNSERIE